MSTKKKTATPKKTRKSKVTYSIISYTEAQGQYGMFPDEFVIRDSNGVLWGKQRDPGSVTYFSTRSAARKQISRLRGTTKN